MYPQNTNSGVCPSCEANSDKTESFPFIPSACFNGVRHFILSTVSLTKDGFQPLIEIAGCTKRPTHARPHPHKCIPTYENHAKHTVDTFETFSTTAPRQIKILRNILYYERHLKYKSMYICPFHKALPVHFPRLFKSFKNFNFSDLFQDSISHLKK